MYDLISRQAVLKLLYALPPEEATTKAMLIQGVKQMDAAQPERKKGQWKVTPVYIKCSECGESFMLIPQNYCPHCGAKMEGEQDG